MESQKTGDADLRIGPEEAENALLVVERMRRTALRRGLPPRWLGAVFSILAGGMCGAQAADYPQEVTAALMLVMVLVLALKRQMLLALAKRSSYAFSPKMISLQLIGVIFIIASVLGGKLGLAKYGLLWAPIATGAVGAAIIYILFEFKLSMFRASFEEDL